MKIEGSGSASGSISHTHGSAIPDPDPHENVMDPQHREQGCKNFSIKAKSSTTGTGMVCLTELHLLYSCFTSVVVSGGGIPRHILIYRDFEP